MRASLKPKLICTSTVPISLETLLKGQLAFLHQHFEVIAVSGPGKPLTKVAVREGVATQPVRMHRSINPVGDLISLWRLYHLFRRERPAIVHSITPKAGLLSMVAAYLARVPVRLHTFTGLVFPSKTGLFQKILILMDRVLCVCATRVYPEGEGVKCDLIRYKITNKPLQVIGNGNVNGIDSTYFSKAFLQEDQLNKLKKKKKLQPDDFVFVFVGRLVTDKGINELVKAFERVNQQYPNTKLLLVGHPEPKLDPLLPETDEALNNHPSIVLAGYQTDVRPWFAVSQALVFPSYREGFPNVVMQAGAMGLPAIVTDINGCNEIIKNGHNGLIIPPKNQLAIEQAMIRLLEDQPLRQKLVTNARESIVSRFEQKTLWKLIKQEYDLQLQKAGIKTCKDAGSVC